MSSEHEQFDGPPKLANALREAYTHRGEVPADRERFILSAARVKFARRARTALWARWGGGLVASLAAALVLIVWLNRPADAPALVKGDMNDDRSVDMVDAMVLARRLAVAAAPQKQWDVNGDGAVNQKDVDAVAGAAVSLKQGGMARRSLPRLEELGIDRPHLASGGVDGEKTFAEANPAPVRDGRQ